MTQKKLRILDTGKRNEVIVFIDRRQEYSKQYYKRPEVIAKRRTPEKLAYKKEYDTLRNARPEVRERNRIRQRRYRNRNNTKSLNSRGKKRHK